MALLEWQDRFSVGVPAVDHEHQELIELVNKLHDALLASGDAEAVDGFFGELIELITRHFALEERFMREHGYDQLREHKTDHEALLDEIHDIAEAAQGRPPEEMSGPLAEQLAAWFLNHSKTHDARLHGRLGPHH
jgi:hemerythrin